MAGASTTGPAGSDTAEAEPSSPADTVGLGNVTSGMVGAEVAAVVGGEVVVGAAVVVDRRVVGACVVGGRVSGGWVVAGTAVAGGSVSPTTESSESSID